MASRGHFHWLQKEFWLYVSLRENEPTSHFIHCPIKQFPKTLGSQSLVSCPLQYRMMFILEVIVPFRVRLLIKWGMLWGLATLGLTSRYHSLSSDSQSDPVKIFFLASSSHLFNFQFLDLKKTRWRGFSGFTLEYFTTLACAAYRNDKE